MNFSIAFLFFATVTGLVNSVHGVDVLQVLFNNGQDLYCGTSCCTFSEWRFIQDTIYYGLYSRRELRVNTNIGEENALESITNAVNSETRELGTYATQCASVCAGYATGRCMGMKCLGYRRKMLVNVNDTCENQKTEYKRLLSSLFPSTKLRSSCKALLQAPLLMTCSVQSAC
jgi:hypothetical protein